MGNGYFRKRDGPTDIKGVQPACLIGLSAKSAVPFLIERC